MLAEEQRQRSADSKAFAAEIEGLASKDIASWPNNLRGLFQQKTRSAVEVSLGLTPAALFCDQLIWRLLKTEA